MNRRKKDVGQPGNGGQWAAGEPRPDATVALEVALAPRTQGGVTVAADRERQTARTGAFNKLSKAQQDTLRWFVADKLDTWRGKPPHAPTTPRRYEVMPRRTGDTTDVVYVTTTPTLWDHHAPTARLELDDYGNVLSAGIGFHDRWGTLWDIEVEDGKWEQER